MSNSHTIKNRGRTETSTPKRTERPKRVSMSGARMRMHVDKSELDPNFHYAWINDQGGLIFNAKRAGYEHVLTTELPSWGDVSVDSAESGSSMVSMPVDKVGTIAYFMKQPMEYYEEDQAELRKLTDAREADMKKELNSGQNGTYGKVEIN